MQSTKLKILINSSRQKERESFTDEKNVQTKSNFLQKIFHSRQTLIALAMIKLILT
jgi:hypothetical protein